MPRVASGSSPRRALPERVALDHLYRAIRRAKRSLFEIAEPLDGKDRDEILAHGTEPTRRELDLLLAALAEVLGDEPDTERLAHAKRLFFQEYGLCGSGCVQAWVRDAGVVLGSSPGLVPASWRTVSQASAAVGAM